MGRSHIASLVNMVGCKMRNKPCPCGSGKKYKKCCLGRAAREALAWKLASTDAMFHMARAEGVSVVELQADYAAIRAHARTRNFTNQGTIAAAAMLERMRL